MNQREKLASENCMAIEFVNWFFDHKKDGCGNAWFMMMAAMWEGWSAREAQVKQLAAENVGLKELIEQHANSVAVCPNCSHEEPSETDDIVALYRSMETPSTDSFLAEVRASAIEHAASERWGSGYVFDELNEFAAQLRKGVQS
ncbi:TPA: hypothetical protein NBO33_004829 [Enterobacter hormaechei]|uniref:hypothetical protein n=1 Tax=Enterobacter hormaechei TaxID=158836 RepID=UPI0007921430|nr:hypothetical protein [Enterobacter hormaechei]HCM9116187.1 hypothetical protein [Enterobacter hormaechei subsp. steigerwaltii]MBD8853974.1 hypothetical protein [Enterobacter hormaechei]CZU17176.1 Uncharacterised protein [Enterobacter hormaechei]SAC84748.1 Uncharacterised protein [Enterobacter hormaechei]SAH70732.1 Uncharacterised protein [Enterobacter hormaechei]